MLKRCTALLVAAILFVPASARASDAPSIYPPPHTFRFPDSILGSQGCLTQPYPGCKSFDRHYAKNVRGNGDELFYQSFQYGVKPLGVSAQYPFAYYAVNIFDSTSDAQLSNGNSISMAPADLFVDSWLVIGGESDSSQWHTGYVPSVHKCVFNSVRTYRNLSMSVYVSALPVSGPCVRTRQWILLADRTLYNAAVAYANGPQDKG